MPPLLPFHLIPRISAPRALKLETTLEDADHKTYSSTGLWGKRKMTYAELETAWREYNEAEERSAISYATSEHVDRILSECLRAADVMPLDAADLSQSTSSAKGSQCPPAQGTMDEHGYLTLDDASSSLSSESCASEETIRPSRSRHRRSPSIVRDQLREATRANANANAHASSSATPESLECDDSSFERRGRGERDTSASTIRPLRRARRNSSRPSLYRAKPRPRPLALSLSASRGPAWQTGEDEDEDGTTHHVEEVLLQDDHTENENENGGGEQEDEAVADVPDIPERPSSRLGFFDEDEDEDD